MSPTGKTSEQLEAFVEVGRRIAEIENADAILLLQTESKHSCSESFDVLRERSVLQFCGAET